MLARQESPDKDLDSSGKKNFSAISAHHLLQLVLSLGDSLPVVGVDDEDDSLRVLEVVAPQRPDLVLAADVPHGEADVLVLDGLDVEACDETRALFTNQTINDQLRQRCFQRNRNNLLCLGRIILLEATAFLTT